jgi:hypothetical protein
MDKNQKGFAAIEALVILVILILIGFAGWFVWSRSSKPAPNAPSENNETTKTSDASTPNVKIGWKTVSKNGLTVSYPEAWDNVEENYQKLQVDGKLQGDTVYAGFGTPFGYKYLSDGSWIYVDSDGEKVDGTQPKAAPASVVGSDSTIIVSAGDGGCGGSKIGFVYKDTAYAVSLPWECDAAVHGSAGISGEIVAKDLADVIRSIHVN